jgi:hypothetical protein
MGLGWAAYGYGRSQTRKMGRQWNKAAYHSDRAWAEVPGMLNAMSEAYDEHIKNADAETRIQLGRFDRSDVVQFLWDQCAVTSDPEAHARMVAAYYALHEPGSTYKVKARGKRISITVNTPD